MLLMVAILFLLYP